MPSSGSDVFGYIAGSISLIALGVSVFRARLPSVRMKDLEEVLNDTEMTLQAAVEAGLLPNTRVVLKLQQRLTAYVSVSVLPPRLVRLGRC